MPISSCALMIIAVVLLVAVAVAAAVARRVTRQSPLVPVEVSLVSVA
jgi:hypothetical protein